ncbi:hypothetical protein PINS_up001264 [Pythium insidiosum]|nr:hypothetical protein PINS_up001264 [Pythium insidiosum]
MVVLRSTSAALDALHVRVHTWIPVRHPSNGESETTRNAFVEVISIPTAPRTDVDGEDDLLDDDVVSQFRISRSPIQLTTSGDPIQSISSDTTDYLSPIIECEFDREFCVPQIVGIRLPNVPDGAAPDALDAIRLNDTLVLQFSAPTTRPPVSSRSDVEKFIRFTVYIGEQWSGSWSRDGRELHLRIMGSLDPERVLPLQELMQGLTQTTLHSIERPASSSYQRLRLQGDIRFRIDPPGRYRLRLATPDGTESNPENRLDSAISPVFSVRSCDAAVVILKSSISDSSADDGSDQGERRARRRTAQPLLPAPRFALRGVTSHGGSEGLTLRDAELSIRDGAWSLSMWLWTAQRPTGAFRTLFFHGNGSGEHRTPSAWFRPDDRRLVLRVSTTENMDVGLDSQREIPLNEWVHLGFSFRNCSSNATTAPTHGCPSQANERPWTYALELYVNGVLDTEMRVFAPVLANTGPLHIGKGPWTDGVQGLVSGLEVFNVPLSASQQRAVYREGRERHESIADADRCRSIEQATAATNAHIDVVLQVAYLTQCLTLSQRYDSTPFEQNSEAKHKNRELDSASTAVNVDAERSAKLYAHAQTLAASCGGENQQAWDILLEAADLRHALALRDVGIALLHGSWLEDACPNGGGLQVSVDPRRAREYLVDALRQGQWDAAQPLGLLLSAYPEYDADRADVARLAPLQLGLLHLAASMGSAEAFVVLGHRYKAKDTDVSAYHFFHAAQDASRAFHERGKQPLHELHRLYDGVKTDITQGERGDDDDLIQFQKMRADKDGDLDAMAAMGDLYYWGARGMPRDHEQAYSYFHRAAQGGHTAAQSAVAGMLLRGEGAQQDNDAALKWYRRAAEKNHTRALNGLGFLHFEGAAGLPENKTIALELFERAAANEEDGDSLFNAGYCHAHGLGTPVNWTRAIHYYDIAAKRFGHFDAILTLGTVWYSGVDAALVKRDPSRALTYLRAASDAGRWGAYMRRGFDLFLERRWQQAALKYHAAEQVGVAMATSNLAYLYDQHLRHARGIASERLALQYLLAAYHSMEDKEVLVPIGDYHFYGRAGLNADASEALRWYSRASAAGVEAGAYNVGHMHEYGLGVAVNMDRAERYYRRALELAPSSMENWIAIRLAITRLVVRRWVDGTPLAAWLEMGWDDRRHLETERCGSNARTRLSSDRRSIVGCRCDGSACAHRGLCQLDASSRMLAQTGMTKMIFFFPFCHLFIK